jgi:hypothetical protein
MNSDALYKGIKQLITNPGIARRFSDLLRNVATGNEMEINKFYAVIES